MRMLAMANEDTLADTRKARLTPARLTRDMMRAKHRNASKVGFNPGRGGQDDQTRPDLVFLNHVRDRKATSAIIPIMKYAMAENKKMGMMRLGRRSAKILDRK